MNLCHVIFFMFRQLTICVIIMNAIQPMIVNSHEILHMHLSSCVLNPFYVAQNVYWISRPIRHTRKKNIFSKLQSATLTITPLMLTRVK